MLGLQHAATADNMSVRTANMTLARYSTAFKSVLMPSALHCGHKHLLVSEAVSLPTLHHSICIVFLTNAIYVAM